MKYCNTCGATIKDNTRYCPNCGMKTGQVTDYDMKASDKYFTYQESSSKQKTYSEKPQDFQIPAEKSKAAAIALSIFPPGMGLLYVSNWKKGLTILFVFLIVMTIDIVTKVAIQNYAIGIPISIIGYPSTIIWSIVSTNKHFKNNDQPSEKYTKKAFQM